MRRELDIFRKKNEKLMAAINDYTPPAKTGGASWSSQQWTTQEWNEWNAQWWSNHLGSHHDDSRHQSAAAAPVTNPRVTAMEAQLRAELEKVAAEKQRVQEQLQAILEREQQALLDAQRAEEEARARSSLPSASTMWETQLR